MPGPAALGACVPLDATVQQAAQLCTNLAGRRPGCSAALAGQRPCCTPLTEARCACSTSCLWTRAPPAAPSRGPSRPTSRAATAQRRALPARALLPAITALRLRRLWAVHATTCACMHPAKLGSWSPPCTLHCRRARPRRPHRVRDCRPASPMRTRTASRGSTAPSASRSGAPSGSPSTARPPSTSSTPRTRCTRCAPVAALHG